MIHCPTGIAYSYAELNCWFVLIQFINFPVAIFVFMAGYFVNESKVATGVFSYFLNRGAIDNSLFHMEYRVFNERFYADRPDESESYYICLLYWKGGGTLLLYRGFVSTYYSYDVACA